MKAPRKEERNRLSGQINKTLDSDKLSIARKKINSVAGTV